MQSGGEQRKEVILEVGFADIGGAVVVEPKDGVDEVREGFKLNAG